MAVMDLADAAQLGRRPVPLGEHPEARIEEIAREEAPDTGDRPRYKKSGFGRKDLAAVMRYAAVRGYFPNGNDQKETSTDGGYMGYGHPDGKTARITMRVDRLRKIYDFWVEDRR